MNLSKKIHIILFVLASNIWSNELLGQNSEDQKAHSKMNGYSLSDFKGFEKDWKLVTVRFRKDSGEMRWTFANEMAWKTLESGAIDYPDGAIFGKIAMATAEDTQFISSVVPTSTRRYLFMVRDQKKHSDTGGWGYALFDSQGRLFPEEASKASQACYACHKIVENRGYVFSQPFFLASQMKNQFDLDSSKKNLRSALLSVHKDLDLQIKFTDESVNVLNLDIKKQLNAKWEKFRRVQQSDITKNLFQGTLDEIRPTLELETRRTGKPSGLISDDLSRFSILIPLPRGTCSGQKFKSIVSILKPNNMTEIKMFEYCSSN